MIPLPRNKRLTLAEACNNNERTDGPHASLDLMIQTMHRATNPAAENTRKWFHVANRLLDVKQGSAVSCLRHPPAIQAGLAAPCAPNIR